jgi:methyltransferase (TIGR00027 family)
LREALTHTEGALVARSDHDTWHAASSVGVTATMIAAIRAIASKDAHAIVNDPFAEPLVKAVGIEVFTRLIDGEIPPTEIGDDPHYTLSHLIDSMTVRTRFFDDFFVTAADAGIRQAVILASGLDTRAYRLPWPDGALVYEIDQAPVIEFKTRTLSRAGASRRAEHRSVAVDLRHDWAKALLDNGFDITTPTAWSAEGLLMYLPPSAQNALLDAIGSLSVPGSRLATEYHPDPTDLARRGQSLARDWRRYGLDLDLSELMYEGERTPVIDYLSSHGWMLATQSRPALFATYGLPQPDSDPSAPLSKIIAVTATRQ